MGFLKRRKNNNKKHHPTQDFLDFSVGRERANKQFFGFGLRVWVRLSYRVQDLGLWDVVCSVVRTTDYSRRYRTCAHI